MGHLSVQGRWVLRAGGRVLAHGENLVTDAGITHILRMLSGETTDAGTFYVALGTGMASPSPADTTLQNEVVRVPAAIVSVTGNEMMVSGFFVAPAYDIEEAGIFCGPGAGTGPGTGVLLARWLLHFPNAVDQHDLTVDWTLSMTRA